MTLQTITSPDEPFATAAPRWSVLVTLDMPGKDVCEALFDAICRVTVKIEEEVGVQIDVSGQPLKDLGLPDDY